MPQSRGHVFISYKNEDRAWAQQVRGGLKLALGCDLWWDQSLQTGGQWNEQLDQALQSAASIVVLWSKRSCESPWVQQEAAIAKVLGVLYSTRPQIRLSASTLWTPCAVLQARGRFGTFESATSTSVLTPSCVCLMLVQDTC
jgi:hypothetical protein